MESAARQQRFARALVKRGRAEDAAAALSTVPSAERDATGHLVAGVLAVADGDLEQALSAFEAGLMLEAMPELAVNRCVALRGLHRDALEPCREAIRLAPEDPRGFLGLAEEGLAQRAPAIALEALEAADPLLGEGSPIGWAASLNLDVGRWEPACRLGLQAGLVGLDLARACAAAGQRAQAREMAESLLEAQPELLQDAAALLLRMATDEAEASPPGPGRSKAVDRARRWSRRLEEPHAVGVLNDLGRLHALEGDEALAEARWREAMALAPEEAAPRLNLAQALWTRGAHEAALELVEAHAGLDTAEGLRFGLLSARWRAQRGEQEEALAWLTLALERCQAWGHSDCVADVGYELALQESEAGRGEAALRALRTAAEAGGARVLLLASRESAFEPVQGEVERMRMDLEADLEQGSALVSEGLRQ